MSRTCTFESQRSVTARLVDLDLSESLREMNYLGWDGKSQCAVLTMRVLWVSSWESRIKRDGHDSSKNRHTGQHPGHPLPKYMWAYVMAFVLRKISLEWQLAILVYINSPWIIEIALYLHLSKYWRSSTSEKLSERWLWLWENFIWALSKGFQDKHPRKGLTEGYWSRISQWIKTLLIAAMNSSILTYVQVFALKHARS